MNFNYKQSIIGSTIAFLLATSCCWLPWLVVGMGGAAGLAGSVAGLEKYSSLFMLAGAGFLGLGIFQFASNKSSKSKLTEIKLLSTITCPYCQYQKEEQMPVNACQYFYECTVCKAILKPKKEDCCVFCSYGNVPCPPVQQDQDCCN